MEKHKGLWNKNFILLIIGSLVSRLGTVIYNFALAWWLLERTGTAKYTGYVMAASFIPAALIGPMSGVLVDRLNRKYVLVWTDIIAGITSTTVGMFLHFDILNLPLIVVAGFIIGCCYSLFRPASKSIISLVLDKEFLIKGNSIMTNIIETTRVVGPMIGAILLSVPFIGAKGIFIINGISYFISAFSEVFIEYQHQGFINNYSNFKENFFDGFRYTFQHVNIRNTIILCSITNFFLTALNLLMPLYVMKVLNKSSTFYSITLTFEAVGGIFITIIMLFLPKFKPKMNYMIYSLMFTGSALLVISIYPSELLALSSVFFIGVFLGIFNTLFSSYIQVSVQKEYMGRVFSILFMISTLVMPLANIFFGQIGNIVISSVFLYAGLGIFISSTVVLILSNKTIGKTIYKDKIEF
ncbi:MFS transporter [Paramaledivibacter caminithermalis]|jgi:MFS family permease|uniref:MFS-type transporter involved in bile tolerance, Atg22 family n=1 Tax=Paramaledivibacter caminithermalis (strain DSM 15212 / CIP 107654 / DViRD3) TaxID=1121301 RepID=A0A1M6U3I0_PARC5|nr:MFS transporter [Paramaledivibacter caminithermalis]SHK63747.1 MFS-type transporter involved in bile tolerance, Atg22 family [Paramaledivibacter caminithermalis DSM 15212]